MDADRLQVILNRIPETSIGVLGDFCLDRYFDIDPDLEEVSLETGRPCHQVVRVRCFPGGAGTVTNNLHSLGVGQLFAVGPIGEDGEAFTLKKELGRMNVHLDYLLSHPQRLTPSYNKPMMLKKDSEPEEQDRLDIRSRGPLIPELEEGLIASLDEVFSKVEGLIVLDQFVERNEHAVTDRVREKIQFLAMSQPEKIVFADSRARIGEFRNMILKPNEHEAAGAQGLGEPPESLSETKKGGFLLAEKSGKPVYVTLGERGILLCDPDSNTATHIPGFQVPPPIDICGAGDSTTAGIVSALCAGADLVEAGVVGCLVASITVQQIGVTGTATPEQVLQRFQEYTEAGHFPRRVD